MVTLPDLIAAGVSAAIALGNIQVCAAQDLPSSTQYRPNPCGANTLPVRNQPTSTPEDLNPNPNPLRLPTKPEQVQIRQTEPITLQQALDLARRNNLDLQTAVLTLERSRASRREAEASQYPTLNMGADLTRGVSRGNKFGNQR